MTAFYHSTKTFALWGAISLFCKRSLPTWYVEHFQILSPDRENVSVFFNEQLDNVAKKRYQRSCNLIVFALQDACVRFRLFRAIGDLLAPLAVNLDFVGRPTSCFHAGTKKHSEED
jgi:hypothetical protein